MYEPVRIVYAGPLNEKGECQTRLNVLRKIEPDISEFDTQHRCMGKSIWARLDRRFSFIGTDYQYANADFLALCDRVKPEIVWIDKGIWLWPTTLATLRRRGVFLAQHNTDRLSPKNLSTRLSYKLLRAGLHHFHVYFTTNLIDYADLLKQRVTPVELTYLGYDSDRWNDAPLPDSAQKKWANDLVFVGHYEPRTERFVIALMDAGLNVAVYGYGWQHAKHFARINQNGRGLMIGDKEYVYLLKSAKIGLSFISEWNENQTAGRTFQIAAVGKFLLAMRTPQHAECFKEGEEAEFFSDTAELVAKATYYLDHDDKRLEIARRGHERCMREDYSIARYMREDWAKTRARFDAFRKSSRPV
ncbi:MAG: glycosyltransferase [Planctomycetota bacterium]